MIENELVPETAIDYEEVFRGGGRNHGDEDFALFKCPSCGHVYLLEYEVDTVYLDGNDLSRRVHVFEESFDCVECGLTVPQNEPWVGPKASTQFGVTLGTARGERVGMGGKALTTSYVPPFGFVPGGPINEI